MSRFGIRVALFVYICLLRAAAPAAAEEASLQSQQEELLSKVTDAEHGCDFSAQLKRLSEMRAITVGRENEAKVFGVAEIDFYADDAKRAIDFSPEQMELASEKFQKSFEAKVCLLVKDYDKAISLFRRSTEISDRIYGDSSYNAIIDRVELANAIITGNGDLKEGMVAVEKGAVALEKGGMTSFRTYGETQLALTRIYAKEENFEKTLESGVAALALMEKYQLRRTYVFMEAAGLMAQALNRLKRHEEAFQLASKGRLVAANVDEEHADLFYRLLLESARAKAGLQQREDATLQYAFLIHQSEQHKFLSEEQRLQYLTEYAEFLKSVDDQDRLSAVEKKLAKLSAEDIDAPQPIIEKSRYSN